MNGIGPVQVSDKVLLIGVGVAVVLVIGGLWYVKYKIGETADDFADAAKSVGDYLQHDAIDATSGKNVANVAVNTVLQAVGVTGKNNMTGKDNTVGSAVYEGVAKIKSWF